MKKATFAILPFALLLFSSCNQEAKPINENTFIYGHKVYKVVDNEVREIANLNDEVRKISISKAEQKNLGRSSLGFVKPGAFSMMQTLYRGNYLYYKIQIDSLNDLKENYVGFGFTLELKDQYGFILNSVPIQLSDLIGFIGDDKKIHEYQLKGKIEMSSEIGLAIANYDLTSSIEKR